MSDVNNSLRPRPDATEKVTGVAFPIDVVLVSSAFGVLQSPALALGILQARVLAADITVKSRYFTLDYAALVGIEMDARIASGFPRTTDLVGEWIFSHGI